MNPKNNVNAAQHIIAETDSENKSSTSQIQSGAVTITKRKLLLAAPMIIFVVAASIVYPLAGVLLIIIVFIFLKKN